MDIKRVRELAACAAASRFEHLPAAQRLEGHLATAAQAADASRAALAKAKAAHDASRAALAKAKAAQAKGVARFNRAA